MPVKPSDPTTAEGHPGKGDLLKKPEIRGRSVKNPDSVPTVVSLAETLTSTISTTDQAVGQASENVSTHNSVLLPSMPVGFYLTDSRINELAGDYEVLLRRQRPKLSENMIQKRIRAMRVLMGNTPLPQSPSDPLLGATVRMRLNRAGKIRQDKPTIRGHKWPSLQARVDWRISQSGIGDKADGTAVFSALFMEDGSSKRMNAAAIWWLDLDIDSKADPLGKLLAAVLRTPEQYQDFIDWGHSLGACDGYSTSSHDPQNGRFHAKFHFPLPEPISYLERALIGHELRRMVADRYGIEVVRDRMDKKTKKKIATDWACIDPVAERGVQLHHNPRTRDLRRWSQHRSFPNVNAPWISLGALLRKARERIDEEAAVREAKKKRSEALGESSPEAQAQERIAAVDLSDRQKKAIGKLAKLGQAEEGNGGDDTTFTAIGICIKCGLSIEEAMPILLDWDDDNDPPWGDEDLLEYAERVYEKAPDYMAGCALPPIPRNTLASAVFESAGVFDLDASESGCISPEVAGDQKSLLSREKENFGLKEVSPPPTGRIQVPGGGSIPRPKYATVIHTSALPALSLARLRCRATLFDSACGTQKTRSMIPLVEECRTQGLRVVGIVPSQSLSSSQAELFGVASHLDDVVRWEGSLVTCFDSVWKIKLSIIEPALNLESEDSETLHPIRVIFVDELNEINDLRTGKTLRDAHRCDLVQGKLEELAQDPNTRWVFGTAHADIEAVMFVLNDIFGWTDVDVADYETVTNTKQVLTPRVFIGHDPEKLIQEIADRILSGSKAICFTSTVPDNEYAGRKVAMLVMSARAKFDVEPFCGPHGEGALDDLPELEKELQPLGLSVKAIRPKIQLINADRMTAEAQAALRDPSKFDDVDLLCHTSSIRSGFNIDRKRYVFEMLREGAGPAMSSNHQAAMRDRQPEENMLRVSIVGSAPIQSQDWKEHHQILTSRREDTDALLEGITTWRPTRRDGTKYLTDRNAKLVEAEARRRARHERETHIADRLDDMGRVVQPGVQALFWESLGWEVTFLHELECQNSWSQSEETRKYLSQKKTKLRSQIKKTTHKKIADANGMDKAMAERMKKKSRLPEIKKQVENFYIRWRYGVTEITADDVAWDAKHWEHVLAYSVFKAMGLGAAERSQVIDTQAEAEGPITACQWHSAVKAEIALRWLAALGMADLKAFAASGAALPSLGDYLENNPKEFELCQRHWSFRLWSDDLEGTALTRKFLRTLGLETPRGHGRDKNGKSIWIYTLSLASIETMDLKSDASVRRLLDPDKAAEQWAAVEAQAKISGIVIPDMNELIAGILSVETPVVRPA